MKFDFFSNLKKNLFVIKMTDIYLQEEELENVNVTEYANIYVFLFNLSKELFIMNKQILHSGTFDKNPNVIISIQLVFYEKLKNIIEIDVKSIKTFSCNSDDNLYCYCIVSNEENCFQDYWKKFNLEMKFIFDVKNYEIFTINYENLSHYLENHKEKFQQAEKRKIFFQDMLNKLEQKKDGKIQIYNPAPLYYTDKDVKHVALLLFNEDKKLFFVKYRTNWILPRPNNPTGVIFLSLANFFEDNYSVKIHFQPYFTRMILIKEFKLMVVLALTRFQSIETLFTRAPLTIQKNFEYKFVPYDSIFEFCSDEKSHHIMRLVEKEMEEYTKSNIFPKKKKETAN